MEKSVFLREQFLTLREETKAIKSRIFWIVVLGAFGVPIITYLATCCGEFAYVLSPMIPYLVIVLIVMFLAEHNALMRCGRYVRERIEPHVDHSPGWETWLGSRPGVRLMDKHLFAVFVLVFFVYYFMAIGFAVDMLWREAEGGTSRSHQVWLLFSAVTYAIGGIWAVSVLFHHWRSVTTTDDETNKTA
ncbi:MAG: hypothetical protein JXB13_21230 [Phycisphaerae bacterium]|nr:hypothetical protein [Phycisphaerae bacterium]